MAVSNTSSTTGAGFQNTSSTTTSSSTVSGSQTAIAGNFDQFLSLLTTQLKNQSPLDPLDTNQFTAQLVQFAGVEQQLKMNDTLSALLTLNKATTTTDAVGFIGATITADGATAPLKNGSAYWSVNMASAGTANITVKDSSGSVVRTLTTSLAAGEQTVQWDGSTSTGGTAPAGDYTITVDATDVSGQAVVAKTEIIGVVDSIDLSGDAPMLKIGTISVPIDKVKKVIKG
ncbi:flagellar basal-body rod modification protein FlgD [Bosea sp. BE125]|uniref:flagellar hook assembly protein FlgD n=1 Tax=Bosea sp. BE125 TaxID=2817909 RepID=UPI00285D39A5|nr:flagellar hook capping FlgD N-terminal domain-containing protein [Bosea sp. BE125]MDR6869824.1 flagellar basal-body rod modification protein FlgD [Bosea sp. BE125]